MNKQSHVIIPQPDHPLKTEYGAFLERKAPLFHKKTAIEMQESKQNFFHVKNSTYPQLASSAERSGSFDVFTPHISTLKAAILKTPLPLTVVHASCMPLSDYAKRIPRSTAFILVIITYSYLTISFFRRLIIFFSSLEM